MSNCNHQYKTYSGLFETYPYCTACGLKKSEIEAASNIVAEKKSSYFRPLVPTFAFHDKCPSVINSLYGSKTLRVPVNCNFQQAQSTSIFFEFDTFDNWFDFPPYRWITRDYSGTKFHGVDRSIDEIRLSGTVFDGRRFTIEEALLQLSALIAREGAKPSHGFMQVDDYQNFLQSIGKDPNQPSFTLVNLYNHIVIFPDEDCPRHFAYILEMDTWRSDPIFGIYCTNPSANGAVRLKWTS